jgi:hypothetical protein
MGHPPVNFGSSGDHNIFWNFRTRSWWPDDTKLLGGWPMSYQWGEMSNCLFNPTLTMDGGSWFVRGLSWRKDEAPSFYFITYNFLNFLEPCPTLLERSATFWCAFEAHYDPGSPQVGGVVWSIPWITPSPQMLTTAVLHMPSRWR